ncbi:MAG: PSD1 and planctomycete cytochrome C domain-containing protein, partial [Planctomycetota bacterium]
MQIWLPKIRGVLLCVLVACGLSRADQPLGSEAIDFFESKIRPVLVEHCYECHAVESDSVGGELLLDSREGIARGGENGPAIDVKSPGSSRLLIALRYDSDDLQMPPDGQLASTVVADFEKWIAMGAPDPRTGKPATVAEAIEARAKDHWAFVTPQRPEIPVVKNEDWPKTDTDRLILCRLEKQGLTPSPRADRFTLVRRLYYDLIGLPPTYEEVSEFLVDDSEETYLAKVDELLESPHFGEKWARHWMDLCRYGDTKGYVFQEDRNFPNAYKFRDWVINAFNDDLPYDQFLTYQLAADLLPDAEEKKHLAAHGYITLGRRFINNKHDIVDDRIDVVFRGMMGLTVTCARCHDHKYDPISTKDYYGMSGVFWSSREQQDKDLPLRLVDKDKIHNQRVLVRGNPGNRGDEAQRRFPTFFTSLNGQSNGDFPSDSSGRLELARAITHRNNPLTARVFVNRVWSHLFGKPIVETTSDFGLRSSVPIHQDVLDCLAVDFVEQGWSMKRLIRQMVLSQYYRTSSQTVAALQDSDPENLMLWRRQRRRLGFEAMRDSLLKASGHLDSAVGGESIKIETMPPANKRTLYAHIDRQNLPNVFRNFDFASPDAHSPRRLETTVPQQALFFLNSLFVQNMASKLSVRTKDLEETEERIRRLYELVFARQPTEFELQLGRECLQDEPAEEVFTVNPWSYGYGGVVDQRQVEFHRLEHYDKKKKQWQGEDKVPGPTMGWVLLNSKGGHPGGTQELASVRRWTAPATMKVRITGSMRHLSDKGDGIRGRIISSRQGNLGEWFAKKQSVQTKVDLIEVQAGE